MVYRERRDNRCLKQQGLGARGGKLQGGEAGGRWLGRMVVGLNMPDCTCHGNEAGAQTLAVPNAKVFLLKVNIVVLQTKKIETENAIAEQVCTESQMQKCHVVC